MFHMANKSRYLAMSPSPYMYQRAILWQVVGGGGLATFLVWLRDRARAFARPEQVNVNPLLTFFIAPTYQRHNYQRYNYQRDNY